LRVPNSTLTYQKHSFQPDREYEIWKTKIPRPILTPSQQQQQQQQRQHEFARDTNELKSWELEETTAAYESAPPASPLELADQEPQQEVEEESAAEKRLEPSATAKPWFFRNGEYYPKPAKTFSNRKARKLHAPRLFPHQDPHSDRVVNQLMYVPHNYEQIKASGKLKTILLYNGLGPWNVKKGREIFLRSKCPVDTCELTANRDLAGVADMILYKDNYIPTGIRRPSNHKQVSMMYYLECPYHTQNVKVPDAINWTATYR